MQNYKATFKLSKKTVQNQKYFIYRNKKYLFNFNLLKHNSILIYENRKKYKDVEIIHLLNDDEEKIIYMPDNAIENFINCCQEEQFNLEFTTILPIQYLAYKYKVSQLITITEEYIESQWEHLVLNSILFKMQLSSNLNNDNANYKEKFYNNGKEEEYLALHINDFIDQEQLLLLPIEILYQIFQKVSDDVDIEKVTSFLFKCLNKFGRRASILFSSIDFQQQTNKVVDLLLHEYGDVFDFNMINSTLLKTTSQLTSEMTKIKKEYEFNILQMKKLFEEQRNEMIEFKKEQIELRKQDEIRMSEREEILRNELESMKCEMKTQSEFYEKEFQKLKKNHEDVIGNSVIEKYKEIARLTTKSKDFKSFSDDLQEFIIKEIVQKNLSNSGNVNENENDSLMKHVFLLKNLFDETINSNNLNELVAFIKENFYAVSFNLQMTEALHQKNILPKTIIDLYKTVNYLLIELNYQSECYQNFYKFIKKYKDDNDDDVADSNVNNENKLISKIRISLIIPENESIEEDLMNNKNLYKVKIHPSVTEVEENAFTGCTKLKEIEYNPYAIDLTSIIASSSISHLIISTSVTSIINGDFDKMKNIMQITIPSSVVSIGARSFSKCSKLEQISIPSSVISIGDYCFSNCSSLEQITIPSSVISIGDYCFAGCDSLKKIEIPSSVKLIGNYCFAECISLEQVTILSSITSIGNYCFYYCNSLKQITIPSSVTSIGNYCFYYCNSLKQITIPSSVISIGDYCFSDCSKLEEVSMSNSVISLSGHLFGCCRNLKEIIIPSSVTTIGDYSFYGCSSLKQVTIPTSVKSFGSYCFYGCELLEENPIPSSAESVGSNAYNKKNIYHNMKKSIHKYRTW